MSKPEEEEDKTRYAAVFVYRREVLVTGTDLFDVSVFVCLFVLFIAFCDINANSALIDHHPERIRPIFEFLLISVEVFTIQIGISTNVSVQGHKFVMFNISVRFRLSGDTKINL